MGPGGDAIARYGLTMRAVRDVIESAIGGMATDVTIEGRSRFSSDLIAAVMEGTVMRLRPKLMTVGTTMIGLVPLLWATGTGADVMKRIAAPMVGGLVTSAFLTLEIIPVIYTYWRIWEMKRRSRA